jgi:hypothetical protein
MHAHHQDYCQQKSSDAPRDLDVANTRRGPFLGLTALWGGCQGRGGIIVNNGVFIGGCQPLRFILQTWHTTRF